MSQQARTTRVMVVEDHSFARASLCNLVGTVPGFAVCGEADSADAALALLATDPPDMCIVDILLPGMSGLDLAQSILRAVPECRILIVSAYDDRKYAAQARDAGALGYVNKGASIDALIAAIRSVGGGDPYFS